MSSPGAAKKGEWKLERDSRGYQVLTSRVSAAPSSSRVEAVPISATARSSENIVMNSEVRLQSSDSNAEGVDPAKVST